MCFGNEMVTTTECKQLINFHFGWKKKSSRMSLFDQLPYYYAYNLLMILQIYVKT